MNVLYLTHRLPFAPNRGDRIRAFYVLEYLQRHAQVSLVSLVHDDEEASEARAMGERGDVRVVRVPTLRNHVVGTLGLLTPRPLTHALLSAPGVERAIREAIAARRPDCVVAFCSGMARFALAPPLNRFPLLLDMVDVDSAKWAALARVSRWPLSWLYRREARALGRFEAEAARTAAVTTVVTAQERDSMLALAPAARVEVVPNGVDLGAFTNPGAPGPSANVVFCGVMNYTPNEHAAVFLAEEVWPAVRARHPSATLTIVGSTPTSRVQRLANARLGVTVTGSVPDVRPFLWQAAASAAPLFTARGIQNKVLEAVASGLPTVVTPNVFAALPEAVRDAVTPASTAGEFAEALVRLLDLRPEQRRQLTARADLTALRWEHRLAPLAALLADVAASPRRGGGAH